MSSFPPPLTNSRQRISAGELAEAIHARDHAAFLVEPRVLRRVIKDGQEITSIGLQPPHCKSYAVSRDKLLEIVDRDELLPDGPSLPRHVILLPLPNAEQLAARTAEEMLIGHWRLLFHVQVHLTFDRLPKHEALTLAGVRRRIHMIGQTQFDEIRATLRSEYMLLSPRDLIATFIEFAAVYLELRYFAPEMLKYYFPSITNPPAIEKILAENIDADELYQRSRPEGVASPDKAVSPAVADASFSFGQGPQGPGPSRDLGRDETSRESSVKEERAPGDDSLEEQSVELSQLGPSDASRIGIKNSRFLAFEHHAAKAETAGNLVRGAILRMRAAGADPDEQAGRSLAAADKDIRRLAERLQQALGFPGDEQNEWEKSLRALLQRCRDDRLTLEGRLLYDLQKVCVDHEREIYTIDFPEWLLSFGRKPIRRTLPVQREVLICKHLRSASRRLPAARLARGGSERFPQLLHEAISRAEKDVRGKVRPHITRSLRKVGLQPRNLPEEVARNKVVEELADRAAEHGYLRFGDLRDAVSRNQLKLPDLVGGQSPRSWTRTASGWLDERFSRLQRVGQAGGFIAATARSMLLVFFALAYVLAAMKHLFFGDHLLQADRQLARRLDGVYHRAEIYLRFFHRFASLGFGTGIGRVLNRFLIFPVLAAFILIVFAQEMGHLTRLDRLGSNASVSDSSVSDSSVSDSAAGHDPRSADLHPNSEESHNTPPIIAAMVKLAKFGNPRNVLAEFPYSVAAFMFFSALFLGLFNSAALRKIAARAIKFIATHGRIAVHWLVTWLALPIIQAILRDRWFLLARRYVIKPLVFTGLIWLLLILSDAKVTTPALLGIFVALEFLLNTRFGRDAEEIGNEWLTRTWLNFRTRVLAGLFWLIVDWFKALLEAVDRVLYAVDEWLRFRQGESVVSFFGKAVLGAVWFLVTYLVRFAVNLLIEPQINPIKHFPVVTVSHKVVWALAFVMAPTVATAMDWEKPYAIAVLSTFAWMIPGIFGFMAWELKESWKLYRTNRPLTLRRAVIGHHAETMLRFMRPGIHSGTLPKLYRKIRRAHRKARKSGQPVALLAQKHLNELEHVRHALAHYFERELLYLLEKSPAWRRRLSLGEIQLGSNSIRVEFKCPELSETSAWLGFEEQSRWLVAGILQPGWIGQLSEDESCVFRNALIGLYKTSGVHLIGQQISGLLPHPDMPYDIADEGLVVWPDESYETEAVYDLDAEGVCQPRMTYGDSIENLPILSENSLLFTHRPLDWAEWVQVWEQTPQHSEELALLKGFRILPPVCHHGSEAAAPSWSSSAPIR